MTRTVAINDTVKKYTGKNIKSIIKKVELDFPQIENWSVEHYDNQSGCYLRGDCDEGIFVSIPNV